MKPLHSFRAMFVALVLAISAACSDKTAPLSPAPAPELSLIGDLTGVVSQLSEPVTGVLECRVAESHTATKVVGPFGGTIQVGPHSLYIPAGALSSNQTITATAPAGNVVEVEFQPHGLKFSRKTYLTMSYRDCGLVGQLLPRIAYVDEKLNILEVLLSVPNVFRQTVTGPTDHFSSYMLAD